MKREDIYAAQVLFDSQIPIWQIPMNVYAKMNISFAELVQKVKPCGAIGDQPTIAALLECESSREWHEVRAPQIGDDMKYRENPKGKKIKVFDSIDRRALMDDFYAKLGLVYKNNG